MVAIIDYGMGNLRSVQKALEYIGETAEITRDEQVVEKASHVILPGVGAFPDAIAMLQKTGLDQAFCKAAKDGKPLLGICLGMQMLLHDSTEGGLHDGLNLIDGSITLIEAEGRKVPHMGWNQVHAMGDCPLLRGVDGQDFYFVHSFCAQDAAATYAAGITTYGRPFASIVQNGNVYGTQFHPEKSGDAGLQLLKNYIAL